MTPAADRAEHVAETVRRATPWSAAFIAVLALVLGIAASNAAVTRAAPQLHRTGATVLVVPAAGDDPRVAHAYWTGPDGSAHTGPLTVGAGVGVGQSRTIWTDADGNPTRPPGVGAVEGAAAAAITVLLGGLTIACARRAAAARARRLRHDGLDEEWAVAEPVWSGR